MFSRWTQRALLVVALSSLASASTDDLPALIRQARERYGHVQDYSCMLSRREWIEGKRAYKEQRGIILKFRKPGSFYLKWTDGKVSGTELLYVQGRDDDRLYIHYTNLFKHLTLALKPQSHWVTRGNRHGVQEAHLGFFLDMIDQLLAKARAGREGIIACAGEETLDGRPTIKFSAELPPGKGYYARTILVNIDTELSLPVKIEVYGWDGNLWESYCFSRLRLNPGLTDSDFDLKNPAYGFNGHGIYRL